MKAETEGRLYGVDDDVGDVLRPILLLDLSKRIARPLWLG